MSITIEDVIISSEIVVASKVIGFPVTLWFEGKGAVQAIRVQWTKDQVFIVI